MAVGLDWNTLLSSGVGALIGSLLTLFATYLSHRWQRTNQERADGEMLLGFLQAIHDEIETLWESYMDGIGIRTEALAEGQPLQLYYPITQEYFTVLSNNTFFIGRVRDADLRKLIVSTYAKARGLVETYLLNNELVHQYERAYWIFQETKNPHHQLQAEASLNALVNYAQALKKGHSKVKRHVQELLRALRKHNVLRKS